MSLSFEYLERCATESGFTVSTLEKVARLGELAGDIGRHAFLKEVLILKGGTALNLCYGAPTRLSVDLDFNYVGALDRTVMLAERPKVEQAVMIRKRLPVSPGIRLCSGKCIMCVNTEREIPDS